MNKFNISRDGSPTKYTDEMFNNVSDFFDHASMVLKSKMKIEDEVEMVINGKIFFKGGNVIKLGNTFDRFQKKILRRVRQSIRLPNFELEVDRFIISKDRRSIKISEKSEYCLCYGSVKINSSTQIETDNETLELAKKMTTVFEDFNGFDGKRLLFSGLGLKYEYHSERRQLFFAYLNMFKGRISKWKDSLNLQ